MTANVSSRYAATPSGHKGVRMAVGLLGLAVVALGIVLLLNPVAAARSLALLLGLSFVVRAGRFTGPTLSTASSTS